MDNNFSNFQLQDSDVGRFTLPRRELQPWWQRLLAGVYASYWGGVLATLTILGMLLAFHQVVSAAVQQGELRRQAAAMHAEATWRCNALRGLSAVSSCLLQLNATTSGDTVRQNLDIASSAPID